MAKFRRNHGTPGRRKHFISYGKIVTFALVTIVLMLILFRALGKMDLNTWANDGNSVETIPAEDRYYLPVSSGEIVHHRYYSLSYKEEWEQAEWVAYLLTKSMLRGPRVRRTDQFSQDPDVSTGSAIQSEYIRSGYTRGHLVPAADMAFSNKAMDATFYTSNIAPQKRAFNGGVWRELEENVRDWVGRYGSLYIISGPIFDRGPQRRLKGSKIAIPDAYFKMVVTAQDDTPKGIAFILPNASSDKELSNYTVTIDEVETRTGTDYWDDLLEDEIEERVESQIDVTLWPIKQKRYFQRINQWNRQ